MICDDSNETRTVKTQNMSSCLGSDCCKISDFSFLSYVELLKTGPLGRIQSTSMSKLNCNTIISYTKQECCRPSFCSKLSA